MKTKRWILGALAVGGALAIAVAGWVASHHLSTRAAPKLLWTEADLPSLPASAENGWELLQRGSARLEDRDLSGDFKVAREAGDWEAARRLEGRIAREVESRAFQQSSATLDAAFARPRFADACPATLTSDCKTVHLLGYGQVAELAIAHAALRGEWEKALGRLSALLRTSLDFERSSRDLVSGSVAAAHRLGALELTRLVLEGAVREKAVLRRARLEAMTPPIEGPAGDANERRAVITEYLKFVSAIRMLAPAFRPEELRTSRGIAAALERLAMDPDDTLLRANAYYAAMMAAVDGGSTGSLPEPRFREGAVWWIHNPTGKMVLQTAATPPLYLHRLAERRPRLLALQEEVRGRLRTALSAALPASTCGCVTGDLVWGRELTAGIFQKRSGIVSCREYTTRERSPIAPGKPPVECTQAFEGCDAATGGMTEVARLLEREDVWAAFEAAPLMYGLDLPDVHGRPMIVMHAGRKVRVGKPCDASLECKPIPGSLAALKAALDAVDTREGQRGDCASLGRPKDSDFQNTLTRGTRRPPRGATAAPSR